ncbi:polymorphic toxin-type HINT domain-containing protein [Streptomyces sp. NBC_00872]|uniref:polymorphic toxin-type HINT domain-containing protein n=1 Tax=Streptomyces sp. NBC_00872 TaxID=2903686 RepID=UPI00386F1A1F|nr:HINT domain-containing protein [Streptomyces sp. NBC_00872]
MASSFVGGILGKLAAKYGMPWKWKKAVALGKRIAGLVDKLIKNFTSWLKFDKKAEKLAGAVDDGCNSFTAETKVLMADGTTKAIKDIDIGDKVVATDPESGKTRTETVTAEIKGKGTKNLVQVTLDTDGKQGDRTASVTATDGHPFWVPELDEWIDATDLHPGQWLRTSAGTYVQITAITRWTQQSTVHNLTVADIHTYYVLAGTTPVLVHNQDIGPGQMHLWRAVLPGELSEIYSTRAYRSPMGAKWFSFTEEGAAEYARRAYAARGEKDGPYTMTRTVINKADIPDLANMPHTSDVVDGGVALEDDVVAKLGRPRILPSMSTSMGCP